MVQRSNDAPIVALPPATSSIGATEELQRSSTETDEKKLCNADDTPGKLHGSTAAPKKLRCGTVDARQSSIVASVVLHCCSGEAPLQPWRSSKPPMHDLAHAPLQPHRRRKLRCNSGGASMQPRRSFNNLARRSTAAPPTAEAVMQLRWHFNAATVELQQPCSALCCSPAVVSMNQATFASPFLRYGGASALPLNECNKSSDDRSIAALPPATCSTSSADEVASQHGGHG